jgi:hypothetical protein
MFDTSRQRSGLTQAEMSSWLKATQRRVKETILQSVGAHDKTEDQEFDEICGRFTNFSRDLVKVHMAMQLWLDSIDLFCGAWIGIGESLTTFCSPDGGGGSSTNGTSSEEILPLHQLSKVFTTIGNDVNTSLKNVLKVVFIDRCLKPIESILAIVPILNSKIQERKKVLLDVGFYKSKRQSELSSGKEIDHPTMIKITNKLNDSTRILELLSNDIINCVDELSFAKTKMLGPEIAALFSCMETFSNLISTKISQLYPLVPQTASTKCLLIASLETAESHLKSNQLVEILRTNPAQNFPLEPILRRNGAVGGTAGGYGHAGFLEGLMSTCDTLLKQAAATASTSPSSSINLKNSSLSAESIERDSLTRDSRISTSSSNNSDTVSGNRPSGSNKRPESTKRPVIKLGQDRPFSSKMTNEAVSEALKESRPSSGSKPSFLPPKPPGSIESSGGESETNRRVPSQRFTASALRLSGSPRHLLGSIPSDQTKGSIEEENSDDLQWEQRNGE